MPLSRWPLRPARSAGPLMRFWPTLIGWRSTPGPLPPSSLDAGWPPWPPRRSLSAGSPPLLVVLKGALIRTGIGALIVGAGELVYWFTRLGLWRRRLRRGDAALERCRGRGLGPDQDGGIKRWGAATAMFYDLKADAATGMAGPSRVSIAFGNTTANTFEGALLAVREIWSRLPAVIGDLVFSAANRMLDGIEAMLNGAIARIDAFTGRSAMRWRLWASRPPSAKSVRSVLAISTILSRGFSGCRNAAADAFRRPSRTIPLTAPDLGLDGIAAEALATANTYRQAATDLATWRDGPAHLLGALRDAVAGTGEEGAARLMRPTVSAIG